jgi:hypothetical protein
VRAVRSTLIGQTPLRMTKDRTQWMTRSRRACRVGNQAVTETGAYPTTMLTHSKLVRAVIVELALDPSVPEKSTPQFRPAISHDPASV